jgi:hypothetical protein
MSLRDSNSRLNFRKALATALIAGRYATIQTMIPQTSNASGTGSYREVCSEW